MKCVVWRLQPLMYLLTGLTLLLSPFNWRGKSVKESQTTGQTTATMLSVLNADNEATAPRNAALFLSSILQRMYLKANLKAWHRWRILALSDRTSFVPEFVESRASHRATWRADRDLSNHRLTLLTRNLMRWKARIIIKHWSLKAGRICKIQAPILRVTNRQRQKDTSVAFHL